LNLLIVDDEYYSVEGIYQKIQSADLGLYNLFRAYSLAQAQERFATDTVDILITDIEMPKGSGLELVAWVREHRLRVVCIFLTSFAKFDYASTAIKLQGFEYLLKPVEEQQLILCVRRAIARAREQSLEESRDAQATKWRSARIQLAEQFWQKLAEDVLPRDAQGLATEAAVHGLPAEALDEQYLPVLLRCQQGEEGEEGWNRALYEFSMKNIVSELLLGPDETLTIARVADNVFFIPLPLSQPREVWIQKLEHAAQACTTYLSGQYCFWVGVPCGARGMSAAFRQLSEAARKLLTLKSCVRDILENPGTGMRNIVIPTARWSELLMARRTDLLAQEARGFLLNLCQNDMVERKDLIHFYHELMRITYAVLDKTDGSAHRLFDSRLSELSAEDAVDGVEAMLRWMDAWLNHFQACMEQIVQSAGAVHEVCRYIRDHLADDLTRDHLAATVYISPDYLSHAFREKTGQSLTAYILEQRVQRAKELLLTSSHSVRDIALLCGFQNISYFAKQFRRATGEAPQTYRKTAGK
jgi:two-component system response regulator YesN